MAVTLTFGDVAENHVGMQKHGEKASKGLSIARLEEAAILFRAQGVTCEMHDLVALSGVQDLPPASLLVIRGGVNHLLSDIGADHNLMLAEQSTLVTDKHALMRGAVKNKLARHNLCFSDVAREPDYSSGQGRVVAYSQVPLLDHIRTRLPEFFGPQVTALQTEGNYYYDITKCGIGFHGDGERRIVIALRLGQSIPLQYQWFCHGTPIGARIAVNPPLQHGDIYAMSEKAVGTDWRRTLVPTLRHAAGASKYLIVKRE